MLKLDKVVIQEIKYIAAWMIILSIIMEAVFLIIGKWDYTVLLGNLLGALVIMINFIAICITVQTAVQKDEKDAKQAMKASHAARTIFIFVAVVVGVVLSCFNTLAVIIPLLFPRLAIAIRPVLDKKKSVKETENNENEI